MESNDYSAQARELLKKHDVNGAISVLQLARDQAEERGDYREASDFAGWAGALFLSNGRTEAALQQFEAAESYEPNNPYHTLTTAEQLLNLTDDAEAAMRKLRSIEGRLPANASTRHHFYDLLGQAHMGLAQKEEAAAAFRLMIEGELLRKTKAQGLCFGLVRRLIAERALISECRLYLDAVESIASDQNAFEAAGTAAELKSQLGKHTKLIQIQVAEKMAPHLSFDAAESTAACTRQRGGIDACSSYRLPATRCPAPCATLPPAWPRAAVSRPGSAART